MASLEVLDTSTSLCPECFAPIACRYEAEGGKVYQAKECPTHGVFRAKYWDDVEHYRWTQSFAPTDCCAEEAACAEGRSDRKRCLAVIDVTENCNLACDYCFAGSRPGLPVTPVAEIRGKLETVLRHGGPTPIQLSGGEPTTRDDLPDIVHMARDLGFTHIEVNSNGIRLADEPTYAAVLKAAGATTIYLQFDGFGAKVHKALRNKDLTRVKRRAIEHCRSAGLPVILVPTIVPGTNEHQLGDIVRFALQNIDIVRGVNMQPVSHFGRHVEDSGHLSLPAVAKLIAEQTGFVEERDLLQVPCCSPNCSSATMLLATGADRKGVQQAMPLTRFIAEDAYKAVVAAFEETQFMDLLAGRPEGVAAAVDAAACCGIPVPEALHQFTPRMLALTITGFMDADTVDLERLGSCCINVPTKDGLLVPFCGYNLTNRDGDYALREQYASMAKSNPRALPVLP